MKKCALCGKNIPAGQETCPDCGGVTHSILPDQNVSGGASVRPENPPEGELNIASVVKPIEDTPADTRQESSGSTQTSANGVNAKPYLIWSVLMIIFCCMPLGALGAYYSNKAAKALTYEEGAKALETAKIICIIGTIVGFIGNIIYIAVRLGDL